MHTFKLTTEQMISRYVDDKISLSAIAKEAGCAVSTVHRRLTLAGVVLREAVTPRGIRNNRVSDEALAETVRLYEIGFSIDQVGELLHLSPSAVQYRLTKMAGIKKLRGPHGQIFGTPPRIAYEEIHRTVVLYQQGYSSTEVGERLGISSSSVIWRLKVAGIPIRSRKESLKLRWARQSKQTKMVA